MREFFTLIVITLLFSSCAIKYDKNDFVKNHKQIELSKLVIDSSENIDKKEAKDFAIKAINYSKFLANDYNVVAPALFHNSLVNMGLKSKGYCYHYANDLMHFLKKQNYKSFDFIKIVSSRGEYFEHTSVLLTNESISFENSIVLDAWRDCGDLYFSKVKDDKRYIWEIK